MLSELDVLGWFVQNPQDYAEHRAKIGTQFWELDHCKLIWDWMGYFWSKEKRVPNWGEMCWAVGRDKRIVDEEVRSWVANQVNILYDKDPDWVCEPVDRDSLCVHLLQQQHSNFALLCEQKNFLDYGRLLEEHQKTNKLIEDIRKPKKERDALEFYGQILKPFAEQNLLVAWDDLQAMRKNRLRTGWDEFDWMLEGGLGEGELSIIHGRTGDAKSLVLGAVALNVLRFNPHARVLYVAADNTRLEMYARLRANVSRLPMGIGGNYDEGLYRSQLIKNTGPRWDSRFLMVRWARGQHSVQELWDLVGTIEEQEKQPDLEAGIPPELDPGKIHLILGDYIGVMKGSRTFSTDARRHEVNDVATTMGAIAEERDRHVMAGHQTHRAAKFAELVSDEHASEDYGVVFHSSLFFNINRNRAERAANRMKLYASKARRTFSHWQAGFSIDTGLMTMNYDHEVGIVNEDNTTFQGWAKYRDAAKEVAYKEEATEAPKKPKNKQPPRPGHEPTPYEMPLPQFRLITNEPPRKDTYC